MAIKKKNKKTTYATQKVLLVIIGVLFLLLIIVTVAYLKKTHEAQNETTASTIETGSIASLGSLQYDFSSGKAVKRTDEHLSKLQTFLIAEGNKSVGPNCATVHHNVILASPDEKQVLLDYGCGEPGSRMFAVQTDGAWKTISPTNQFDLFGIPMCRHVNANNIDRSIAPVCATQASPENYQLTYTVR